jgi:hypothetical protein
VQDQPNVNRVVFNKIQVQIGHDRRVQANSPGGAILGQLPSKRVKDVWRIEGIAQAPELAYVYCDLSLPGAEPITEWPDADLFLERMVHIRIDAVPAELRHLFGLNELTPELKRHVAIVKSKASHAVTLDACIVFHRFFPPYVLLHVLQFLPTVTADARRPNNTINLIDRVYKSLRQCVNKRALTHASFH